MKLDAEAAANDIPLSILGKRSRQETEAMQSRANGDYLSTGLRVAGEPFTEWMRVGCLSGKIFSLDDSARYSWGDDLFLSGPTCLEHVEI